MCNNDNIISFSKIPRKGLLVDFSKIELEQSIEFENTDFNDIVIFEMQVEKIKERAKELNCKIIYYSYSKCNVALSDSFLIKFIKL